MGIVVLAVLVPLAILIIQFILLSKTSSHEEALQDADKKLDKLTKQLSRLEKLLMETPAVKTGDTPATKEEAKPITVPVVTKPPIKEKETAQPIQQEELPALKLPTPETGKVPEPAMVDQPVAQSSQLWQKDLLTKTDWEKFIGENLANKIGIAILVTGIAFFVKFAIDKDWIRELGRVIIGLASGGILVALAHYTRNKYRSFSSVLVGGGISVFYFTIAFAFHEYHLIDQRSAFIIMIVITGFAVALSLLYNRIELAILATLGGFATPFLVSTGDDNYVALFTYLAILNSGLLVMAWFKKWKSINIIALFATMLIYGGWMVPEVLRFDDNEKLRAGFLFATLFYLQFVAMNIVNNLRSGAKFTAPDFMILFSINFFYYLAGVSILENLALAQYKGLFTVSLGVLSMILALTFYRKKQTDRNFIFLLITLTLSYISLAAPVQLEGNQITLFWAAEAVALFWLFQRSRIPLLKIAVLLIVALMLGSLFMDWTQLYGGAPTEKLPVLANEGFITTVAAAVSLFLIRIMLKTEAGSLFLSGISTNFARNTVSVLAVILLFASGAWEIFYQFSSRLPDTGITALYLQLYTFVFVVALFNFIRKNPSFGFIKLAGTIFCLVIYFMCLSVNNMVSTGMLVGEKNQGHFAAHWLGVSILLWLLYRQVAEFRRHSSKLYHYEGPFTWITSIAIVIVLSVEMHHVFMWMNYGDSSDWEYWENLYYKAGLSILWGLCSFTMMWLGMKHSFRILRIISLTLFTITILKLFLFDIVNIPPGGKIAAFILLGVLLLIISFMYQRLKRIIIDDAKTE